MKVLIFSSPSSSSSGVPSVAGPDGTAGVASIVYARNSIDEAGNIERFIVAVPAPDAGMIPLERILESPASAASSQPLPFSEYAAQSLQILRSAAARIKANPASEVAANTESAVCDYFVAACLAKLRSRCAALFLAFDIEALGAWTPTETEEVVPTFNVVISNNFIGRQLEHCGLVRGSNNSFNFDVNTAAFWWKNVLLFLELLRDTAKVNANDINAKGVSGISAASRSLHYVLRKTPAELWEIRSLNDHIRTCRRATKPSERTERTDTPQAVQDDVEDYEDDVEDALPADKPLPARAAPESESFYRMADALCAWTTGPTYLMSGALSRAAVSIDLSVISLPRAPIATVDADGLVLRWAKKGKWPSAVFEVIGQHLQKVHAGLAPLAAGACHCEAGLMASLLFHSRANPPVDSQDADAEDADVEDEPAILAEAFQPQDMGSGLAIGVAKKCCPVCQMLAEIIRDTRGLDVQLPGQHTRYYAWVPPNWLPADVLLELERRLLRVVFDMAGGDRLKSSSTSSPASDRAVELPDFEMWGQKELATLLANRR
ncbi:hypothetical protein C8R44DRAFT_785295 [Mycena epipterygia]|nr:hypothetical protein C8R44DRAFT_785295 [Mycena epipterygia]